MLQTVVVLRPKWYAASNWVSSCREWLMQGMLQYVTIVSAGSLLLIRIWLIDFVVSVIDHIPKDPRALPMQLVAVTDQKRKSIPKEVICLFASCTFCPNDSSESPHQVPSDSMGETLVGIKVEMINDTIQACVTDSESVGDASDLEKYYHRKWLRFNVW